MKAYTKKWGTIGGKCISENNFSCSVTEYMIGLCDIGPCEFKKYRGNWYTGMGFYWHISWLKSFSADKQLLLRFE